MFKEQNDYFDTMIALKKVTTQDVRRMIQVNWNAGVKYDMYRHDYNSSNLAKVTSATNLYEANYYVVNEDFKVYICLNNGTDPENPKGRPSLDQPKFTDLEPKLLDLQAMDMFGNIFTQFLLVISSSLIR